MKHVYLMIAGVVLVMITGCHSTTMSGYVSTTYQWNIGDGMNP